MVELICYSTFDDNNFIDMDKKQWFEQIIHVKIA